MLGSASKSACVAEDQEGSTRFDNFKGRAIVEDPPHKEQW